MKKQHVYGARKSSTSNNSGTMTRAVVEAQRWELRSWVIASVPDLAELMESARPPTIRELIQLAQQRAVEHVGKCPHCGGSLSINSAISGQPCTLARARADTP
jgi:hypothetical protein